MKTKKYRVKSKVTWKWLGRSIHGILMEVHLTSVSRTLKGKKITRNGSAENPAYLVCSEAGNEALKLQSELSPAKPAVKK